MTVDSLKDVTPVFAVPDVDAAASWYRDVLGFEFGTFPETPPSSFAILSRDGVEIFLQRACIHMSGLQSLWDRVSSLPGTRGPEDYVLVFAEQTTGAAP